ncbi:MAG: Nif11-like leader peptide family RiPP precursor [Cyanobacteriota bacterium]|jgi:predicted ribosomally synthesized peptide with nif11-like leader|nr:Nif11-like leader peptide family RiPP precursor [Cyanobacteriota bacterium]
MSLELLDAFLAHLRSSPALSERLARPLDLEEFLSLAHGAGFPLEEADVIAAQVRAEADLSDEELQARAGAEARRLRHFIQA